MGIFDKLFGRNIKKAENPENSKLFELLEIYVNKEGKGDSYKNIVLELMHGNSFLLLPSVNDNEATEGWTTTKKDTILKLNCIFNLDGLKVLGAFTDEKTLLIWAKKPTEYTALPSKTVLQICEENNIDRVVINSDSPTMFVLERNKENIKTEVIKEDTTVQVGTPNDPLDTKLIKKLVANFMRIETIQEVYQYGLTKNDEFSIVLGFKLSTNTENARTAAINSVQNAFTGENIHQLVDLFFIKDDDWYNTIQKIENSLIYKK